MDLYILPNVSRGNTNSTQSLQKLKGQERFPIHFIKYFWYKYQRQYEKKKIADQFPSWVDTEIFNKLLANKIQKYIKRIIHVAKQGLFQGYKAHSNI